MGSRVFIVENCKSCPHIMIGSRGFYCHENPEPIKDPSTIPDICELPKK